MKSPDEITSKDLKYTREEFERLLDFGEVYLNHRMHREALEKFRIVIHELLFHRFEELADIYDRSVAGLERLCDSPDPYVWETSSQIVENLPPQSSSD